MNRRILSGLRLVLLPASLLSGVASADILFDGKITLDGAEAKPEPGAFNLFDGKVFLEGPSENLSQLPIVKEAEEQVKEETGAAPGEERLPPDLRVKWRSFFAKCLTTCRSQFTSDLRNEQKQLIARAKLDVPAANRLKEIADAALDDAIKAWEPWFAEHMLSKLVLSGEAASLLDSLGPRDTFNSLPTPEEVQPLFAAKWRDGIKTVVEAGVLTDLEKERAEQRKRVMEQMEDRMDQWGDPARENFGAILNLKVAQLQQFAGLSEEKNQALKKAADEAIAASVAQWRERCVRMLMASSDSERANYLEQDSPPLLSPRGFGQRPEYADVWLKARQELITPEDLAKMEGARTLIRTKREQALAKLTLAEMEKVIGFSPAQRESLLVEAYNQMESLPDGYYERSENNYYSIDMSELLGRMKKIPEEMTKKILTEGQNRRWSALTVDQLNDDRYSYRRGSDGKTEEKAPPDLDEAGAQRLIGLMLEQEAAKLRASAYNQMEARAELVINSVKPEPPIAEQIRTAAKGAAEFSIQEAVSQLEQNIMSQFRNVKPAEVPKRLKNLSIPSGYSRRTEADPAIWTACLERLLSEEQRKILASEQKEQSRWLQKSISEVMVTDINRSVALAPDKMEALQNKMDELMEQYGEDITSIFSRRWYLQGYYGPIPLALLTDKEMAEYFTPAQLEVLRGGALGRAAQYSTMIKQRHKQRTKKK